MKILQRLNITLTIIALLALAMVAYHTFVLTVAIPDAFYFRPIHVMFAVALCLLIYDGWGRKREGGLDFVSAFFLLVGAAALTYWFLEVDRISWRYPSFSPVEPLDKVAFFALLAAVLEACRRTIGLTLPLIAAVVIVHALHGGGPSFMNHPGVTLTRLVDHLFLTTSGIFGSIVGISATDIFAFTLFGATLLLVRGGDAFMAIAFKLTSKLQGGPAKASIVGSAFFGMLSGSAVANIYTTGSVTIPLMKRTGIKPHNAAAIEATASNVGNWMPPVMGTSAFLVAEYTGHSYAYIALIAIVPAALYILALYGSAHFMARRISDELLPVERYEGDDDTFGQVFLKWFHLLIPIGVLIFLLARGTSSYMSALYCVGVTLVVGFLRPHTRFDLPRLAEGLRTFGGAVAPIAVALIVASTIVGALELTGVTLKFASAIVNLSGGNFHLTLVLVACSGIILGMGLPNVAAYVITMIFGVPALTRLGLDPLVAHMFVFYFANLSSITPPVCLASFAAAAVAQANVFRTAVAAVKLALPAFALPFIIAYNPVLILQGETLDIIVGVITAAVAVLCIGAANEKYLLTPLPVYQRVFLLAAGAALVVPHGLSDLVGAALLGLVLLLQVVMLRRPNAAVASEAGRPSPTSHNPYPRPVPREAGGNR